MNAANNRKFKKKIKKNHTNEKNADVEAKENNVNDVFVAGTSVANFVTNVHNNQIADNMSKF